MDKRTQANLSMLRSVQTFEARPDTGQREVKSVLSNRIQ